MTVALIAALQSALGETRDGHDLARLAHHVEDSLYTNTGLQDQASAVHGGASLYEWNYAGTLAFTRVPMLEDLALLSRHMVVAHTGKPHPDTSRGASVIKTIKRTGRLGPLLEISDRARAFANAVRSGRFDDAARALDDEAAIRASLIQSLLTPEDEQLLHVAKQTGCGSRLAGRGGAVWAIGSESGIADLRTRWHNVFTERGRGRVLDTAPTSEGVRATK